MINNLINLRDLSWTVTNYYADCIIAYDKQPNRHKSLPLFLSVSLIVKVNNISMDKMLLLMAHKDSFRLNFVFVIPVTIR